MIAHIRAVVALLVISALTATFLGLISQPLTIVELIPALLAANIAIVAAILIVTALLGRIYCAVLCPLGIFQDIVFWFKKRFRKKHIAFSYQSERVRLRYAVVAILFIAWAAGLAFIPALLDPYSIYGRMVTNLLTPLWQTGFNGIAGNQSGMLLEKYDIVFQGILALVIAAAYGIILTVLAWRYGRLYCNTICPVGTLLGTISRFSWLKMNIHADACVACGLCERSCRSSCINVKEHAIDSSRCVLCFDCMAHCPQRAIHFGHAVAQQQPSPAEPTLSTGPRMSRRVMLATAGVAAGAAAAGLLRSANSFSVLAAPQELPIMPPGTGTSRQFLQQCTACHLCVDRCPNQVLRPATTQYGLAGMGKPWLDYSQGYCDYHCNTCGAVCPTDAIQSLTLKAKQGVHIGMAQYDIHECLIPKEGVVCGNCAIHCPAGAITMEAMGDMMLPKVHPRKCIGCGSCEYHCPAIPKAMRVQGKRK